jgi:pimeloyl-ACP methyl ester carboxylesterase
LASSPTDRPEPQFFDSFDRARLAWYGIGEGRPLVLIHGYFSDAFTNWIRYGHAALIAARGFRVIMPDLRAHGSSAKPHDAASYPPDVLMRDGFALVEHLGLTDYDLAGYSLGGRTVMRMLANGATPRRAVLSGMGYQGIVDTHGRGRYFRNVLTNLGSFERGTTEWMTEAFLKTTKGDPQALLRILDTFVDTPPASIAGIATPTLVLTGVDDHDNGSGAELAMALPNGAFREIPGNHMNAVMKPELGSEIADFLAA